MKYVTAATSENACTAVILRGEIRLYPLKVIIDMALRGGEKM
jgi:hypothetical protein